MTSFKYLSFFTRAVTLSVSSCLVQCQILFCDWLPLMNGMMSASLNTCIGGEKKKKKQPNQFWGNAMGEIN